MFIISNEKFMVKVQEVLSSCLLSRTLQVK